MTKGALLKMLEDVSDDTEIKIADEENYEGVDFVVEIDSETDNETHVYLCKEQEY